MASALTATYSANAPILSIGRREYILSPFLNLVTFLPTYSIIPDNSFTCNKINFKNCWIIVN